MSQNDEKIKIPEEIVKDVNDNLPGNLTMEDIQQLFYGRRIKAVYYLSRDFMERDLAEADLSARPYHGLKRAGFNTVGDVMNAINSFDDLDRLRYLGKKSKHEIEGKLFFLHYSLLPKEKRKAYLKRFLEINGITEEK